MNQLNDLLIKAASIALVDDYPEFVSIVDDSFNLYEAVDSFSIVNILLETESAIEEAYGVYIPLADETIFDASKSPFCRWDLWVGYVREKVNAP